MKLNDYTLKGFGFKQVGVAVWVAQFPLSRDSFVLMRVGGSWTLDGKPVTDMKGALESYHDELLLYVDELRRKAGEVAEFARILKEGLHSTELWSEAKS